MSILDYFQPVDLLNLTLDQKHIENKYTYYHIERQIDYNDIAKYDLVILGVTEERNTSNKGTAAAPDKIREQFYQLNRSGNLRIGDLGNLKVGKTLRDTYFAIADIVIELTQNKVIPVILGGGQDITYAIYLAYEKLKKPINLVSIDSKLDLGYKKDNFDADSYIGQIILENGKYLFNYTNLGYQAYYCNKDELSLINKMNFDAYRLGVIRSNMKDIEPVLRDANLVSIDVKSIKQADAPGHKYPSPNGFYSEEICQLARYAGISDNLTSFGIFEFNPEYDINNQTAGLIAQIIWYFIDGVNARQGDFPAEGTQNYTKFIVSFEKSDQQLIFYQNNYNQRWWMEVPSPKTKRNVLVACTHEDYKLACNQELPERWLKTIQKLN